MRADTFGSLDRVIRDMHEAAGRPPIFLIDNWPIIPAMTVVANHEVAEQITRPTAHFPYSLIKSPSVERLSAIIGPKSIFFKNVCFHNLCYAEQKK